MAQVVYQSVSSWFEGVTGHQFATATTHPLPTPGFGRHTADCIYSTFHTSYHIPNHNTNVRTG